MKLLTTISDGDLQGDFIKREAAHGVVFTKANTIPLLYVSKYHYHKLPGGGIEEAETAQEALQREIKEEVGALIHGVKDVGKIEEQRSQVNFRQVSYCYIAEILFLGEPNFQPSEQEEGFQLVWDTLDNAISILERDTPSNYEGGFIRRRDLAFLQEARRMR